jgi:hypothetical protein
MLIYASGACKVREIVGYPDPKRIKVVIHQPRIDTEPQEWEVPEGFMAEFEAGVKPRAALALQVFNNPETMGEHLTPSREACQFCAAKAACPKKLTQVVRAVAEHDDLDFDDLTAENILPVNAKSLDELAVARAIVGDIEDWCKAVRETFDAHVLNGEKFAGWKIVQGKEGNRKWADEADAEKKLKAMQVKHDQMYKYSVISPTAAEKLAKEGVIGPRQWPKLQELITRAEGRPTVAPESDKRPAIELKDPCSDFDDLTTGA